MKMMDLGGLGEVVRVVMGHRDPTKKERHNPRQLHDFGKRIRPICKEEEHRDLVLWILLQICVFAQKRTAQAIRINKITIRNIFEKKVPSDKTDNDRPERDDGELDQQHPNRAIRKLFPRLFKLPS